jgi:hypothetical protein
VLDPLTQHVRTTRNVVFDEDRGWNWPQEKDGNTGYKSYFVIEYLVDAASSTSGGEATPSPRLLSRHPPLLLVRLQVPERAVRVLVRPLQVLVRVP